MDVTVIKMPMDKNSTHFPGQRISDSTSTMTTQPQPEPKYSTLQFIKQFARIYMPVKAMPGLVLN